MINRETTDLTLFVRTSEEDVARWDRSRIVDALLRETGIDLKTAEEISRDVERQIISSGISLLTTALVRELVDAKLVERGLEEASRLHARLGFPLYDVRQLISLQNKENANIPHGPEGTNLVLADGIKREFALHEVFSADVAAAHVAGDIHLHGLGFIDRPYSCCQSLEYLKKFGLRLPHALNVAKPAKHAEVLLAHMVRFGAALHANFAGAIAWDILNLSFAPYLTGMGDKEVRQFAQMLVYEFSQLTSARGGQSMFTDIHLYWHVPAVLRDVEALGPAGLPTGKVWSDYEGEARRFAEAIFHVFRKGDGTGKPFVFPRPVVHLDEAFFAANDSADFLRLICDVATEKGNTCFAFDRGKKAPLPCDGFPQGEEKAQSEPWKMRSAAMQNVTLNLPRLGYRSGGDEDRLYEIAFETLALAVKAHRQKKDFMERLLSLGEEGPLSLLAMRTDGLPYLRADRTVHLIGLTGLNELAKIHTGKELHETPESVRFGLELISRLRGEISALERETGLRLLLEQTPAETTAYRFARLDLKHFSPMAGRCVRGVARGGVYYTNSTQLSVSADAAPLERVRTEGRFHPLIEGTAATTIWLGDSPPAGDEIARIVEDAFRKTTVRSVVFSPDFTTCAACGATTPGIRKVCASCGSDRVDGIAMITQYFSRVSGWNRGKISEWKDRRRFRAGDPSGA
jgi:ribonucleoside-triphosphate reductase